MYVVEPADNVSEPDPDVPVPTTTLTAPPRPFVDVPLPITIDPELPTPDVPELSVTTPLTPRDSTFEDDTVNAPVPLLALPPDTTATEPPT